MAVASLFDDFNRPDGAIGSPSDGGPVYRIINGTWVIEGNKLQCLVINAAGTIAGATRAHIVRDLGSNIFETTHTIENTNDQALIVRMIDDLNFNFYYFPASQLFSVVNGGAPSTIISAGPCSVGDIITFSVDANNLYTIKKNGSAWQSTTNATNAAGTMFGYRAYQTSARVDNMNVVNKNVATSAISITNYATEALTLVNDAITQAYPADSRLVTINGTCSGEVANNIQIRLWDLAGTTVLVPYFTLTTDVAIGASTWTGKVLVPKGGMYRMQARSRNAGGAVLGESTILTNVFGVGDLIVPTGSSSAYKWGNNESGSGYTANPNIRKYDGSWTLPGTDGTAIIMANEINNETGAPVGIVMAGSPGSTLVQWDNDTSGYGFWKTRVTAVGGKIRLPITIVGINDAFGGTMVSKADHKSRLISLFGKMRTFTGQPTLPILIAGTQAFGQSQNLLANYAREAEKEVGTELAYTHFGTNNVDKELLGDNLHLTTNDPFGYPKQARELGFIARSILAAVPTNKRAMKISSVQASGSNGIVNVTLPAGATDFTVGASHGFSAIDQSGALPVSSATRLNAGQIGLAFGRPINGAVTIRYLWGERPITFGGGVRDNSAQTLPMDTLSEGLTTSTVAVAGSDYSISYSCTNGVAVVGNKWVFPAGVTNFNFTVNTLTDAELEGIEKVFVRAQGFTGEGNIISV